MLLNPTLYRKALNTYVDALFTSNGASSETSDSREVGGWFHNTYTLFYGDHCAHRL